MSSTSRSSIARVAIDSMPDTPSINGSMTTGWRLPGFSGALENRLFAAACTACANGTGGGSGGGADAGAAATAGAGGGVVGTGDTTTGGAAAIAGAGAGGAGG